MPVVTPRPVRRGESPDGLGASQCVEDPVPERIGQGTQPPSLARDLDLFVGSSLGHPKDGGPEEHGVTSLWHRLAVHDESGAGPAGERLG